MSVFILWILKPQSLGEGEGFVVIIQCFTSFCILKWGFKNYSGDVWDKSMVMRGAAMAPL